MVEESTKALEEEWADKAEAASTQEEEEEKAKTEHSRSTESARPGGGGTTRMQLSQTHKNRQTGIKTKNCVAATVGAESAPTVAQPPSGAIPKQNSKVNQRQEQDKRLASNPLQLQLYRAMRSYSQMPPADKLKERRYAGLGLGRTSLHGKGYFSVGYGGKRDKPSALSLQQQQLQAQDRAAKVREQCPCCGPSGIEGLPCVCHHALLGSHAESLPPAKSLLSLLSKLPHKRLLVLPALKPDGEETEHIKAVSHDDPRLSGDCLPSFASL